MQPGRAVTKELDFLAGVISKKGWYHFQFDLPASVIVPPNLLRSLVKEITSIKVDEKSPLMFAVIKPTKWLISDYDATIGAQWLEDWHDPLVPFNNARRKKLERNASALATEFVRIRRRRVKAVSESLEVER